MPSSGDGTVFGEGIIIKYQFSINFDAKIAPKKLDHRAQPVTTHTLMQAVKIRSWITPSWNDEFFEFQPGNINWKSGKSSEPNLHFGVPAVNFPRLIYHYRQWFPSDFPLTFQSLYPTKMSPKHHMSPFSPNSVRYSREQPSRSSNQNLLPSSKVRFIFQRCLWLCCYTSEDNTWPMAKFAGPITTWPSKERIDCLCRLVNRTCTESGLIIMFIIILVITIIILILMSHQTGFLTKPENFLVTTTQVFRLHVVDLHRLCDRKIAAPPATLVTLDESLGVEAGGRLRNVGVIDIYPLLNLQKWPCIEQALFFDPMAKMAKNHPANASSREIIKAHMAQWSCHVARTSYHLCFEGSKNPLPKHRMRAGWEFVVSLS